MQGDFLGEDALEKVKVATLHVRLAIGADAEVDGQPEEEREVEVGDAGVGRFEMTDGVEEEVEERRIGLLLADDTIEDLGQEERLGVLHRMRLEGGGEGEGARLTDALQVAVVAVLHLQLE